ncbi:MAG TPA: hypothetical protein ENI69_05970, partial [Rhodospirillales bacterium]|nr:hypothetical protein [Rhodospirillales bacterium]
VATSAVRDAEDGPEFAAEIERRFGHPVEILSGPDEARLAAMGLLCGVPEADGLAGDLGGGSFDLVALNRGEFGQQATLPVGHLRLADLSGSGMVGEVIGRELESLPWIRAARGRALYALGGSCRALARVMIEQTGHPLHVVDNFSIDADYARDLCRVIASGGGKSLKKISGVPRSRMATLPYAAKLFECLLAVVEPDRLVFSGFGMREGQLLKMLPDAFRLQDPLIASCKSMAERIGRFNFRGTGLLQWMAPLFDGESADEKRLRWAACLLSDIGWSEHPDYRAEHAFHRVLRVPFAGLTHGERVLLADAIYVRYNGEPESALVEPLRGLLDAGQLSWVRVVGLALRLAHTIAGSAPGILSKSKLKIGADTLILKLPPDRDVYISETVIRRLKTLAASLGLDSEID